MRRLVEFAEMPTDSWNENIEDKIKDFLTKSEKRQLFFSMTPIGDGQEYQLTAQHELPSASTVDELFYFVKSHYSQEINSKEVFHKHVQYGSFNGNHLISLLRLCSGCYAPLFFGNKTWPDSIII